MQLLTSLPTRGKIALGASVLVFAVVAIMLMRFAGQPSYATILTGLEPTKTAKLTEALDAKGIKWELQNAGTALAVDKGDAADARMALATEGLSAAPQQPGYELLDKQKLGASSFQQKIAYQRALEGQIAQTVGQIDGVGAAQVRLTLPKDDLFADEKRASTAAVLLGGTPDPGAVRGIANLVASSVEGLKPTAVTITDGTGQLLWPSADAGTNGMAASKPAAEARFAGRLEQELDAMLARTLGPDRAQVQVSADLNVDQTTQEQLVYARTGTPLRSVEENENLRGSGGAGAPAGAAGNVPGYAAGAGGAGNNYRRSKTETDYGVNKTVTRTRVAAGNVNRLSVSVLVDKGAKPDVAALTKAIETAVGTDAARGDTVVVQPVAFAKMPEVPAAPGSAVPIPPQYAPILKYAGIGLAALLFLFFMTRGLRRREQGELAEPSWLAELQAPAPAVPALAAGPAGEPLRVAEPLREDPRRAALDDIIQREPERVATQLRSWITEDAK